MEKGTYEYDKVKDHLGHENFQIVGMYNGWTGDDNRATFVSVEIDFEIVEITIDNMTGKVEEV